MSGRRKLPELVAVAVIDSGRNAIASTMPSEMIARLEKRVNELSDATGELLAPATRGQSDRLVEEFVRLGAPEKVAAKVAHLYDIDGSIGQYGSDWVSMNAAHQMAADNMLTRTAIPVLIPSESCIVTTARLTARSSPPRR